MTKPQRGLSIGTGDDPSGILFDADGNIISDLAPSGSEYDAAAHARRIELPKREV